MSATSLRQGDSLPLAVLLPDGDAGKYPQAEVYDPAGNLLGTYDLSHRASGLYTNNTQTMPNKTWVVAVYIVYNEVGHTTESIIHLRSMDTLHKAAWIEAADSVDGTTTVGDALANASAVARNRIVKTGDQYAYRNRANDAILFTNDDAGSERTPA